MKLQYGYQKRCAMRVACILGAARSAGGSLKGLVADHLVENGTGLPSRPDVGRTRARAPGRPVGSATSVAQRVGRGARGG